MVSPSRRIGSVPGWRDRPAQAWRAALEASRAPLGRRETARGAWTRAALAAEVAAARRAARVGRSRAPGRDTSLSRSHPRRIRAAGDLCHAYLAGSVGPGRPRAGSSQWTARVQRTGDGTTGVKWVNG